MVILTKASQQRQNIVEIQKNWIVSSLQKKGQYKNTHSNTLSIEVSHDMILLYHWTNNAMQRGEEIRKCRRLPITIDLDIEFSRSIDLEIETR